MRRTHKSPLAALLLVAALAQAAVPQTPNYQVTQSVFPGGGGTSTQGTTAVTGTIGQGAAGEASGGAYAVSGGFQPATNAQPSLSVTDVSKAEGNAGTTTYTFNVTLSAQAASNVTFDVTTADGSASAGVDYVAGSLSAQAIAAGSRGYQFDVTVNGDAAREENETFFVNVSNVSGASVADGQGKGTVLNDDGAPSAGQVVISEFRLRGPDPDGAGQLTGSDDEFIEIYNATDSDLVVVDSAPRGLGADGWAVASSDDPFNPKYVIPAGTNIPARGHFLIANGNGYSLSPYAAADEVPGSTALYYADIPDGAGLALYRTGAPLQTSAGDLLDRVGFRGASAGTYVEGAGLTPEGGVTSPAEHSFYRKLMPTGYPQDTGDNEADFEFVSTDAGQYGVRQSKLGAPGPENLSSPVRRDESGVSAVPLDQTVGNAAPVNRRRDLSAGSANYSQFGTLSIRRRVTNTTGAPVGTLRFRIVEITTSPNEPGNADLRVISSTRVGVSEVNDPETCAASNGPGAAIPCAVKVEGTTLEQPPAQSLGGGYNSTLSAGTVTLDSPLANGASVNVQFLLGVQGAGKFRFYVIIEALPVVK